MRRDGILLAEIVEAGQRIVRWWLIGRRPTSKTDAD
jgi:hypothetical protein